MAHLTKELRTNYIIGGNGVSATEQITSHSIGSSGYSRNRASRFTSMINKDLTKILPLHLVMVTKLHKAAGILDSQFDGLKSSIKNNDYLVPIACVSRAPGTESR